jgi:MFS family permease
MGVADYVIELGKDQGFSIGYLSNLLTVANVVAISGALLVYFLGTRFGRAMPILLGTLIAGGFTFLFHWSQIESLFFIANAITGVTWAFTVPYLLGLCATFDEHGRVVVFAGFISKMGLASGPLIGAMVVGDGNFTTIINLATAGLLVCGAFAIWAEVSAKKFADR